MKLFLKYFLVSVIIVTVHCSFVCAGMGPWEWQNPSPTGRSMQSVWGSSETDVFAVGSGGAILHFDGVSWVEMPNEFTDQFFGVWGSSANDVFVVGDNGAIIHYNGSSWTRMNSNTENDFREIWGFSANDVYAVGFNGTIVHYNGENWSIVNVEGISATTGFSGVWGDSVSEELFVVGSVVEGSGVVAHYNGNTWSVIETTESLSDVWGATNTDVFAVNSSGTILHFNGNSWAKMEHAVTGYLNLQSVWGSSGNNVFAFGNGRILHYSGGSWTEVVTEEMSYSYLYGAWGNSENNIHVVGHSGAFLHYDGRTWLEKPRVTKKGLMGIGGSSAADVYAVGYSGTILRYDGSKWSDMNSGSLETFSGVWSSSMNDVYAVGEEILHYDGNSWETLTIGNGTGNSVWGTGENDVFIVGDAGRILHYNGASWSDITIGTESLQSVWGSASNDVYAVGYAGTILHYDGAGWETLTTVTEENLLGVWGSSINNIYAVGRYSGTLIHYDGSSWQAVNINIPGKIIGSLYGVWCSSENDVYVVGYRGAVYHYDGTIWEEVVCVDIEGYGAIWGSSVKDVFAVGGSGAILHYIRKLQIQTVPGVHGTISPPGPVSVGYGGEQLFTISADDGYHTIDVIIDGVSGGVVDSYRFDNVTAAHEISAVFERNTLNVPAINFPENNSILSTLNPEIVVGNTLDPDVSDKSYYIEIYLSDKVTPVVSSPAVLQGVGMTTWQPGNDILEDNTSYSIRVRVHDGIGYSSWSGLVDFHVNAINDSPVINLAGPLSLSVDEDGNRSGPSISATDADEDSLVWLLNTPPQHGQTVVSGTGASPSTFWYEPSADYYGSDSFDIAVSDGKGGVDTITINVTVNPVNDPPENTVLPVITISGSSIRQLSASSGTWNDSADNAMSGSAHITFDYQWQMADNSEGLNTEAVEGTSGSVYVAKNTDDNKYFRVIVTATDDGIGAPATESSVAESAWILYSVSSNILPTVPVNESPENNSVIELLEPRLTVNNSADDDGDTVHYIFEVYVNDGSDNRVIESSEILEGSGITEWQIPDGVLENTSSYYWQAKACDATDCSSWSEKKYFSVETSIQGNIDTSATESNGNGGANCFISTLK